MRTIVRMCRVVLIVPVLAVASKPTSARSCTRESSLGRGSSSDKHR
jgi:uncharacterized membrane protein YadS